MRIGRLNAKLSGAPLLARPLQRLVGHELFRPHVLDDAIGHVLDRRVRHGNELTDVSHGREAAILEKPSAARWKNLCSGLWLQDWRQESKHDARKPTMGL
jgi:hypothetical protein